jgi:hypothetical protein
MISSERSSDMRFLGGFEGASQNKETLAMKPEIGWAVSEATVAGTAKSLTLDTLSASTPAATEANG